MKLVPMRVRATKVQRWDRVMHNGRLRVITAIHTCYGAGPRARLDMLVFWLRSPHGADGPDGVDHERLAHMSEMVDVLRPARKAAPLSPRRGTVRP